MLQDLDTLQEALSYRFRHIEHLQQALVHKSYANEKKDQGILDNERLEFLGDAVLDLIVSEALVGRYPGFAEGQLSKLRALIVNESSLSAVARSLDLGRHLLLGRGEEQSGGRKKSSILADSFEAVIAALYLDSNLNRVSDIVLPLLEPQIEQAVRAGTGMDFKTELQELSQSLYSVLPRYKVVQEEGPDHDKTFLVELTVRDIVMGRGKGRSKKEAEQEAARLALAKLQEERKV